MARRRLIVALALWVWATPALGAPDAGLADAAVDAGPPDAGVAPTDAGPPEARRAAVVEALAALPPGDEDPAVAARRAALQQRLALLDELITARRAGESTETDRAGRAGRLARVEAESAEFDLRPPPEAPEAVDAALLESVEARTTAMRDAITALQTERAAVEARIDGLPAEVQSARRRRQAAEELEKALSAQVAALPPGGARAPLLDRLELARLEAEAAAATEGRLEDEAEGLRASDALLGRQIDLARRRLRQQEDLLEQHRRAYERTLAAARADTSAALAEARRALSAARTPTEHLLARGRLLLAETRHELAEAARARVALDRTLAQQSKVLEAERAEFKGLENLVARDTTGRSAEKLKEVFQRLDRRYAELAQARQMEVLDALSTLRGRRLEVAALLFDLDEQWQLDIDALADAGARGEARALRETLRGALRAEQEAIAETLAVGESLQAVIADRDAVLDALDALVRGRIFWVQDKPPIGRATLAAAREELGRLGRWVTAPATWQLEPRPDAWPLEVLAALLLIGGVLLLGGYWRLRRLVRARWPDRVAAAERHRAALARVEAEAEAAAHAEAEAEARAAAQSPPPGALGPPGTPGAPGPPGAPGTPGPVEAADHRRVPASAAEAAELAAQAARARPASTEPAAHEAGRTTTPYAAVPPPAEGMPRDPHDPGLRLVAVALLSAGLVPAALFGLARLVELSPLSAFVRQPVAAGLDLLAALAGLWFVARLVFRPMGLAAVELGLADDTTASLRRATRTGLLTALSTLVPFAVLDAPPLRLETLPRLLYSTLEIALLLVLLRLLRPGSPLVRDLSAQLGARPGVHRLAGPVWLGLLLFGAAVVAMDLGGYRYGSAWLAGNALGSLAALAGAFFAWPPLRDRLAPTFAPALAGDDTPRSSRLHRARKVLRGALVVLTVVALGLVWDVDRRALGFLDAVTLYEMGAGETAEAVTLADLLRVVITFVFVVVLLRWMPRLFGLTLFRYVEIDPGARYAIVTIARYVAFFIGVVVAFDALHVDLSQLGWLVAAVGVGLGFGLQEIVANFVSGIILLMERPIRIGDWVTIGTTEGTVQRINIRATTLLTLDRQEIIVPNKDFITREVVNWTHGDRVVRLTVPIGVAYGTDVEKVRRLLLDIAAREPRVLAEPPPTAILAGHGDSSLDFELRVHYLDPTRRVPLLGALNAAINRALAENGIEIPFPQRDLHLRSGWPPDKG